MLRCLRRVVASLLVLAGAALAVAQGLPAVYGAPVGTLYGPVPVAAVVDGDTFVVASNVGPRTVRLVGVDAPETRAPAQPLGDEAAAWLAARLPEGAPVWLEVDLGLDDGYGRLLAYAYVADPAGAWTVDGRSATQLNLALVEAGLARALEVAPNVTYADLYAVAEAVARGGGVGVWGTPPAPAATATAAPAATPAVVGADPATLPEGPIVIRCARYDPDTPNDTDGEWVELLLREPLDTRGYDVWDRGSGSVFRLPVGVQPAGVLRVPNPGQGVWNNGGDVIHLRRGGELVDAWDYTGVPVSAGGIACRGGR